MSWVTVVLVILAGLIAWLIWKYYNMEKEDRAALKRKLGFFSFLLVSVVVGAALGEAEPEVDDISGGYPFVLPGDEMTHAASYISDVFWNEESMWRSNVDIFMNISNLSNLSM